VRHASECLKPECHRFRALPGPNTLADQVKKILTPERATGRTEGRSARQELSRPAVQR
jgi:hypothetical protein